MIAHDSSAPEELAELLKTLTVRRDDRAVLDVHLAHPGRPIVEVALP